MQSISFDGRNGVLAELELGPEVEAYNLPDGISAQVAIYSSDHFAHLSVMRILLS